MLLLCLSDASFAFFNFHFSSQSPTQDRSQSNWSVFSIKNRVVNFVKETVSNLHYSHYKLGGSHFDVSRGVYVVDCSSYVDNILRTVCPHAYDNLAYSTGTDNPTTRDYYQFFTKLTPSSHYYWDKVDNVKNLEPGDILVFRSDSIRHSRHHHHRKIISSQGHVMIVMSKPIFDTDGFLVRVADSASAGHGNDTRLPHVSGIGIGTLRLKVNPRTGQPNAYAWNFGSYWNDHVKFAMGRPKEDVG